MIVRLKLLESQRTKSFIVIPVAFIVELARPPETWRLSQYAGGAWPGSGGGGRLLISKVTQFGVFTLMPLFTTVRA